MALCKCTAVNKEDREITLFVPARNVSYFFTKSGKKIIVTGAISSGRSCPAFNEMPKKIKAACIAMAAAIYKDHFEKTKSH